MGLKVSHLNMVALEWSAGSWRAGCASNNQTLMLYSQAALLCSSEQ
jgi:hypothetical protein